MTERTNRANRIVELIDNALQSSGEGGSLPVVGDHRCVRCISADRLPDSDFCAPCRAWMLEDSDIDPRAVVHDDTAREATRMRAAADRARDELMSGGTAADPELMPDAGAQARRARVVTDTPSLDSAAFSRFVQTLTDDAVAAEFLTAVFEAATADPDPHFRAEIGNELHQRIELENRQVPELARPLHFGRTMPTGTATVAYGGPLHGQLIARPPGYSRELIAPVPPPPVSAWLLEAGPSVLESRLEVVRYHLEMMTAPWWPPDGPVVWAWIAGNYDTPDAAEALDDANRQWLGARQWWAAPMLPRSAAMAKAIHDGALPERGDRLVQYPHELQSPGWQPGGVLTDLLVVLGEPEPWLWEAAESFGLRLVAPHRTTMIG